MFKLFDNVQNVKMQIQKKRRGPNQNNGGFGELIGGNMMGGNNQWGQQQPNNGWGQQGPNDGWGGQQQGNNGWGQQPNNGWAQQPNNGWGQQGGNNGWGEQQGNNGWGEQQPNNGWGGQQGNNGWGNQQQQQQNEGDVPLQMALFGNRHNWGNDIPGVSWVKQQLKRQAYKIFNPHKRGQEGQGGQGGQGGGSFNINDIGSFIEQQITFLEPSPAEKRLEQLKKQGKTFYDDRFPPNQTSLTGEWGNVHEWKAIEWKKISEAMPGAEIFKGRVQPGDIKQGYLGDCYFLAGLAALAERPDRIFSLFLLEKVNEVKYYSVKMLYKGKWMTIDMDEYFPFLYGKPAFSKANENQLWVMLLEKAWAKMYTSYKRIEAGYPEEALHDLTGAPIKQIYMKQAGFNKEAEWKYLIEASQKQYSMVASSNPGSDTNKSYSGVVQGHAYTFLNATTLQFQGRTERIVQLRNPWGKGQSKGRWCDNDGNWNSVSAADKKRIGYHKDADDGVFFMTWEDFIREFRALTVAEINDNASYIYKSAKDKQNHGVYFKIQVIQPGYYSLHVDKTPERSFEDKRQNSYQYPNATIAVGKLTGTTCQKMQGFSSRRRTLFKGYNFQPGEYIVSVKIDYDARFEKEFDVNLAVYAEFACDIEFASKAEAAALTGNPNVAWTPPQKENAGPWNNLGNTAYHRGDSGWGNNNNGSKGWGDDGWGGQGGQGGSNNGWGGQGQQKGGGNSGGWDDGWGGQGGGSNSGGNNGWGTQPGNNSNNGWGQQGGQGGNSNNGWGDSGWGQQPPPPNNNNGWGQQPPPPPNNNNGWGQPPPPNNNNNNGWGEPPKKNNNNGWGDGW